MVLDEPTASLTDSEIIDLFAVIRRMQKAGVGIVYVSHRLEEILDLTDRVSVMRDGALVEDQRTAILDENSLVSLISGKAAPPSFERKARQSPRDGELAIEVSGIIPLPGRPGNFFACPPRRSHRLGRPCWSRQNRNLASDHGCGFQSSDQTQD